MAHRPHSYSAFAWCLYERLYEYFAGFASPPLYPSGALGNLGGFLAGADKSPPAHFVHCANTLTSTILRGGG